MLYSRERARFEFNQAPGTALYLFNCEFTKASGVSDQCQDNCAYGSSLTVVETSKPIFSTERFNDFGDERSSVCRSVR